MNHQAKSKKNTPRSKARKRALQAIYQWLMAHGDMEDILMQFQEEQDFSHIDKDFFLAISRNAVADISLILDKIKPHLTIKWSEVEPTEKATLIIGAYELIHEQSVPAGVVINEAVELSKTFGSQDAHGFINAVLDKMAREARALEYKS